MVDETPQDVNVFDPSDYEMPELDTDRDIHNIPPHEISADDLLELRDVLEMVGVIGIAARVEIERENALVYDDYGFKVTEEELMHIGHALNGAMQIHEQRGETAQAQSVHELGHRILEAIGGEFPDAPAANMEGDSIVPKEQDGE